MAKAKGTTLIGAVRYLRHHREGAQELLPPDLRHYLEDRVHESSWYPEEDLLGLLRTVVELIPGSREEVLGAMGARTAQEHLAGVYAHLRAHSEESVSSKSFALWASQHDTGRFEIERPDEGRVVMRVIDFGLPSEIMCGILTGYLTETLRFEGLTVHSSRKPECVLRGDPRCTWEMDYE